MELNRFTLNQRVKSVRKNDKFPRVAKLNADEKSKREREKEKGTENECTLGILYSPSKVFLPSFSDYRSGSHTPRFSLPHNCK